MSADLLGLLSAVLVAVGVMATTIYTLISWVRSLIDSKLADKTSECEDYKRERDFWKDETMKTKEELRENAKRNADNQEATSRAIRSIEGFLADVVVGRSGPRAGEGP